ncbi:MAG: glycosyltransferase family 2 protein [Lachnospiraceae bacterium]|nr:glycosyltransferase family 2 protein [Lachnospiraceae bacterium]
MKNIYFIILNYNTTEETKNCIESIRRLDGAEFRKKIVLIDNCSKSNSYRELEESYCNDRDIFMYRMGENLGFSKANNYGYSVVREMGDADFCIVCNSDILFLQSDFLMRLDQEYEKSHFHICGPDIYYYKVRQNSMSQRHQSPMYPFGWKKRYVEAYFLYNELRYKRLCEEKYTVFKEITVRIRWSYWRCIEKITNKLYYNYKKKRHENVPLHGSCIIVSSLFLIKEKKLFLPETKFYGEEWLLYLRSKKNNYKVIYNPEMVVEHLNGRATAAIKSSKEGDLFRYQNYMIAARTYLEELEKANIK